MNIIFFGPQGSGKGTQAKIISKKLNLIHISTGDLFRNLIKNKLKKEIDNYINKGHLIPDKLIIKLLKQRIKQNDCKKGFILDGFPRNKSQAELLDKITKINKAIEINISDKLAIERISSRVSCKKCGIIYNLKTNPPKKENICNKCKNEIYRRADDNPKAIKKRLETYHKETKPILKKYKSILVTINGAQEINNITKEILKNLS